MNAPDPDRSSTEDLKFRLLVESVVDYAIYMLDPQGFVVSWNPGAQRFKGYETAEILGQHFSVFYTEADRATGLPRRALETAAREGRFENEGWRVRKDGGRFWAHVVVDAMRTPDGELVGFAKITRDLTERKRLENQLVQASRLATAGTLVAGLAHELNQPLNVMRMWAENALRALASGKVDARRQEQTLHLIVDQIKRVATLVAQMRSVSRPEQFEPVEFDPAQAARAAVQLVSGQYAEDGVAIESDLPEGACRVHAAPAQLEQVLLTILSNARDAILSTRNSAAEQSGTIWVRMSFDAAAGEAVITVIDNGGGIPENALPHIFDPFFTTKEVGQGTGLALSASYGMIQMMGGRLEAANVVGPDGSPAACFSIHLPARPTESQE